MSAEQKSLDGGCLTKCHRSSQHAPLDWLVAISGPRACLYTLYWAIFTTRTSAKTIVTRAASSKRLKILSTCLLLIPPSAKQFYLMVGRRGWRWPDEKLFSYAIRFFLFHFVLAERERENFFFLIFPLAFRYGFVGRISLVQRPKAEW